MKIGDLLKEIRIERGLSIGGASEQSGISKATISQIESNKYLPSCDKLVNLCKCYNVSADYVLGIDSTNKSNARETLIKSNSEYTNKLLILFSDLGDNDKDFILDFIKTYKKYH